MEGQVLLMVVLFGSVHGVHGGITCSVDYKNPVSVHMQFDLGTLGSEIETNITYFVRTMDKHTKRADTWKDCNWLRKGVLNCSIWHAINIEDFKSKYYYTDFIFEVYNYQNNTVPIWTHGIDELEYFLYDCFKDHEIKDLKIVINEQGTAVQWKTTDWDKDFELYEKFEIQVEGNLKKNNHHENCRQSGSEFCSWPLHGLNKYKKEEVCVITYFKKKENGSEIQGRKCEDTLPEEVPRPVSPHFVLLVSVILGLTVVIVVLLLGVLLFKKRTQKRSDNLADKKGGESPLIGPRNRNPAYTEPGFDRLSKSQSFYAYPDVVQVSYAEPKKLDLGHEVGGDVNEDYSSYVYPDYPVSSLYTVPQSDTDYSVTDHSYPSHMYPTKTQFNYLMQNNGDTNNEEPRTLNTLLGTYIDRTVGDDSSPQHDFQIVYPSVPTELYYNESNQQYLKIPVQV